MRLFPTLLILAALTFPLTAARAAEPSALELMIVLPLDTAAVSFVSVVDVAALGEGKPEGKRARKVQASPAALIARWFHPRFGLALTHAARRVDVIDSSSAFAPFDDPDSSRFTLTLTSLSISQSTRTVARRTVPTSPPGIDPVTGALTPGVRRAYSEGPGRMTTLTARATYVIRDTRGDSVYASGTTTGSSSFRGETRRDHWEHTAQTLALSVLQSAGFAP